MIGLDVAVMIGVSSKPLEVRLGRGRQPFLDPGQDSLDQIAILHRSSIGGHPVVPSPGLKPDGEALDRILAVGEDAHLDVAGSQVQCP